MTERPKAAIYARVSTGKQSTDLQTKELRKYAERRNWDLFEVFIDQGHSGRDTKRPAFQSLLKAAHKRQFDILLVWKLDRMSRSMKDLISTLDKLGHLGIDFVSYQNDMDTTTSAGKLMFHILGAVAEFEKDIISERVKAGLSYARAKGKRLGRPPMSETFLLSAKTLRSQGLSYRKIGKKLGVHYSTLIKKIGSNGFSGGKN